MNEFKGCFEPEIAYERFCVAGFAAPSGSKFIVDEQEYVGNGNEPVRLKGRQEFGCFEEAADALTNMLIRMAKCYPGAVHGESDGDGSGSESAFTWVYFDKNDQPLAAVSVEIDNKRQCVVAS